MPKRWYDENPTVSLAISMLKNATEDNQDSVCEYINKKFKDIIGVKSEKFVLFKTFNKRWYDSRESVYNLLEDMRCCSDETKREIAIAIIDHLCNILNG